MVTVKRRNSGEYYLESDSGREYEIVYGHSLGANMTNDIWYVMDMNLDGFCSECGELIHWYWGIPNFDIDTERNIDCIVGVDIRNYEKKLGIIA